MCWITSQNNDSGSLHCGHLPIEVGQLIEIEGEGRRRRVTYVMGRALRGSICAAFKGQGAVPTGTIRWRIASPPMDNDEDRSVNTQPNNPTPPPQSIESCQLVAEKSFSGIALSQFEQSQSVLLIGFDSAWTIANRGGLTIAVLNPRNNETLLSPINCTFDEARGQIEKVFVKQKDCRRVILAIDQPLIVINDAGRRPVDDVASRIVGRFGSAVQPANLGRSEMFGPTSPIHQFLNDIQNFAKDQKLAFTLDPRSAGFEGICVVEVYPVLATLALFPALIERGEVARYNPQRRKTFSYADWQRLCVGLASMFSQAGLDGISHHCSQAAKTNVAKSAQDMIDACICLVVAYCLATCMRCGQIGDLKTGNMLTPITDLLKPFVEQAIKRSTVPTEYLEISNI